MKRFVLKSILLLFILYTHNSYADGLSKAAGSHQNHASITDSTTNEDLKKLNAWKTGESVSLESIERYGMKRCFSQHAITQRVFQRIENKSYKVGCNIPLKDLRYLHALHYDINNRIYIGELICHKDISNDLLEIFEALFNAHYPIERMVLIDNYNADDEVSMRANNTSCFNFRKVAGTSIVSNHSSGHAVDINPLYNPYVKIRNGRTIFQPKNAKAYINRNKTFPYKIQKGDLCYQLFIKHGFIWGGDWKSVKDFQHFEKR